MKCFVDGETQAFLELVVKRKKVEGRLYCLFTSIVEQELPRL